MIDQPRPKAILYARFSPRPDAHECDSVKNQLKDLRHLAEREGWDIVNMFWDEAVSGADNERVGLHAALVACKRGYIFAARHFDRLSRDLQFILAMRLDLTKRGVQLYFLEGGLQGDDPQSKMMAVILGGLAEYQREVTNARTSAGMKRHQREGRRMSKEPPYGWRVIEDSEPRPARPATADDPNPEVGLPSRMELDPDEQKVIVLMKKLRSLKNKRGELTGFRAIGRTLAKAGHLTRKGTPWCEMTIKRILIREHGLKG